MDGKIKLALLAAICFHMVIWKGVYKDYFIEEVDVKDTVYINTVEYKFIPLKKYELDTTIKDAIYTSGSYNVAIGYKSFVKTDTGNSCDGLNKKDD